MFGEIDTVGNSSEIDDLSDPGFSKKRHKILGRKCLHFLKVPGFGAHGMDQVIGRIQVPNGLWKNIFFQKVDFKDRNAGMRIDAFCGKTVFVPYTTYNLMSVLEQNRQ